MPNSLIAASQLPAPPAPPAPPAADANNLLPKLWKILLVDDDAATHLVTKYAIEGWQFHGRSLALSSAYSAEEARRILAARPDIAVILLDVIMENDMAGLELVRVIRGALQNDRVRIVLRSGETRLSLVHMLENYDVTDFVSKTDLTQERLYATVISALRGYHEILLRSENAKWREAAHQAEFAQKLQAEFHQRIAAELAQAHALQLAILPNNEQISRISAHYGLKISVHFEPAFELAGDYWTLRPIDADHLAIILLDVTGHGIGAALATFYLHAQLTHLLPDSTVPSSSSTSPAINPAQSLASLSALLHKAMPMGTLASGILLIYDRRRGEFSWSSAASPPAISLPQGGASASWLAGDGGGLLGALAESDFPRHVGILKKQDRLLLYSDALVETRQALARAAATGDDTSPQNFLDLVDKWRGTPSANIQSLVALALGDEERPLRDDVTLVLLERI